VLKGVEARQAQRRLRSRQGNLAAPRPDLANEQGSDSLPEIKHIVVLMMENHSYDNYFGMLAGRGDGFSLGPDGQPTETNKNDGGSLVPLAHFDGTVQVSGVPTQAWSASHIQYADGACNGFVRSIEETLPGKDATVAMRYWTEQDLPFYYGLAKTFPLATRWFSSCLGPTFPNRRFLTAGTANGLIDDLPFGMIDYPAAGTIFDLLSAHKISWVNYHNVPASQINFKRIFHSRGVNFFRLIGALLANLFPGLMKSVQSKVQCTADLYPLGTLRSLNHLKTMRQLFTDARDGTMPSVSIIDPDFGQWSEENPQGWSKTILIWTYDEHGGYYDHVAPPAAVEPDDVAGENPMKRHPWLGFILRFTPYAKQIDVIDTEPSTYDRLGFRVPAVFVSPYAKPDFVTDTVYDHTSILKLIEKKWNLPSLTKRDAGAVDPLDALDFASPPAFLTPPDLPDPAIALNL
jgi:phospholipase C